MNSLRQNISLFEQEDIDSNRISDSEELAQQILDIAIKPVFSQAYLKDADPVLTWIVGGIDDAIHLELTRINFDVLMPQGGWQLFILETKRRGLSHRVEIDTEYKIYLEQILRILKNLPDMLIVFNGRFYVHTHTRSESTLELTHEIKNEIISKVYIKSYGKLSTAQRKIIYDSLG